MKRILFSLSIFLFSLSGLSAQEDTVLYSFFTAGHTYGNPITYGYGLHPPFVEYIPKINAYDKMEIGFFTGDVIALGYEFTRWDSALVDINKLDVPIYIAPGNHDVGLEFLRRFTYYYRSFVHNDDLFIILTPGVSNWNITGDQLEFLTKTLDDLHQSVNNIFIFMHELIWWSPTNEFNVVTINYAPHYPGSTNYETVVKPLLLSYPNDITIFAGDLGCTTQVTPFMYHHFDNITLIASGMGGGVEDNIIITDVYKDSVYHKLIAINGEDSTALGELYDYSILSKNDIPLDFDVKIYPNPASRLFSIENNFQSKFNMRMYSMNGQLAFSDEILENSAKEIHVGQLNPGMYFIHLYNNEQSYHTKIVLE